MGLHLERIKKSRYGKNVTVATTMEEGSEEILQIAKTCGCNTFQGSTHDVLDRFYQADKAFNSKYIVRLTSDCPLIDPEVIDAVIDLMLEKDLDYVTNVLVPDFPDGQDVEVVKKSALEMAWKEAKDDVAREHATNYIYRNTDFRGGELFKAADYKNSTNYGSVRMTVDEADDFDAIKTLVNHLGWESGWKEYTDFIINNPHLFTNQKIERNAGSKKSDGK